MALQDSVFKVLDPLKRKLYDYSIEINGIKTQVIVLHTKENMYEDEETAIIKDNLITTIIDFPGEIPLFRVRDWGDPSVQSEGIYLYDILPIELYAKWSDQVEVDDLLVRKVVVPEKNVEPLIFVFRIINALGTFKLGLTWRKLICAPHTKQLTDAEIKIINKY